MADHRLEIVLAARDITSAAFTRLQTNLTKTRGFLNAAARSAFNFKTGLLAIAGGAGLGLLGKSFINTAATAEKLQISLDTITKGHGLEWFNKLNEWALHMPVNTERAIEVFRQLRAMGLKPTIADMTVLVDTASALGGDAGTLEGIGRALGQITTKGKVSAEELMQLAERGIPAYEILKEKFKLTADQMGQIGKAGLNAQAAVRALMEGMADRFGGQSARMLKTWTGTTEALRSEWKEFQRQVMQTQVFAVLKQGLQSFLDKINEFKKTGQFRQWAADVAYYVVSSFQAMVQSADVLIKTLNNFYAIATHMRKKAAQSDAALAKKQFDDLYNLYTLALQEDAKAIRELERRHNWGPKRMVYPITGGPGKEAGWQVEAPKRMDALSRRIQRATEAYGDFSDIMVQVKERQARMNTIFKETVDLLEKSRKAAADKAAAPIVEAGPAAVQQNTPPAVLSKNPRTEITAKASQAHKREMERMVRVTDDAAAKMKAAFTGTAHSMENAFVNFVKNGKVEFTSLVDSMITDLARLAYQRMFGALFGMLPGLFGGGAVGEASPVATTLPGAGGGHAPLMFAAGGVAVGPRSGYPAILHGTEAVVPLSGNRAIPVELKGGGGTNIHITNHVSVTGNPGADNADNAGQVGADIGRAIGAHVRRVLVEEKRPGGLLN